MRPVNEERLQSTLNYIRSFQLSHAKSPTLRTIQKDCGYKSLSTVLNDINRLIDRGLIEKDDSDGWNRIKTPDNIKAARGHIACILREIRYGQQDLSSEDIEASVELPDAIFGKKDHVILRAKGPGMTGLGIFDGDYLVVHRQDSADYGYPVVAVFESGGSFCGILAEANGKPYLRAANDETDADGNRKYDLYPDGEWQIYGVVDYVIHILTGEQQDEDPLPGGDISEGTAG